MPEIKRNFTGGKMNKDVDERLVPSGQYRDALNVQVTASEGSDVGTVQNILGNEPGCEDGFMHYPQSQTVGSVSDEKNDTLYWLVAGPTLELSSLSNLIANTGDPLPIPQHANDRILRKSPAGCEHVLVDKYAALLPIGGNYDQILNQIIIADNLANDMITTGMTVTLIDSDTGVSSTSSIVNLSTDVSDFSTAAVWHSVPSTSTSTLSIPASIGILTPNSGGPWPVGQYEAPDGKLWITQADWDTHPVGTNYIVPVSTMPGSMASFSLNGNPGPDPLNEMISSITENVTLWNQGGFGIDMVKIELMPPWASGWQAVFPFTNFIGTVNGLWVGNQVNLQIQFDHPTTSLTGGIIIPPNAYLGSITVGMEITMGWQSPGCIDSFNQITVGPNTGSYMMVANDCSGTIIAPPPSICAGCDSVTFHTPIGVPGATVINLVDPIDSFGFDGDDFIFFKRERALNFDHNQMITGINILDDMLLWTDNKTEPKKINISRSIEGTDTSGNLHTQLVNNTVNPPLNINGGVRVPLQEKHISVIKKSPKTSLNLQLKTDRDPNKNYSGIVQVCDDIGANASSFISSSLAANIANFSSAEEGDVVYMQVVSDLGFNSPFNNGVDFAVDWNVGDKVVLKEFDDAGAPMVPILNYRIKGVIEQWGSLWNSQPWGNNFNTATGGCGGGLCDVQVAIKITSIEGYPPTNDNGAVLNYAIDRFDESERLFEFKFPRFSYRYKYEDEEYSSFAPFTEVAFVPGGFDYHPKKGYNLGMTNRVTEITLMDFITQDTPLDVVEIDLLYKDDSSPNVYVINTVKPKDLVAAGALNEWSKNSYAITSETVNSTVASNQLLRPWDNVPRKALAQEVTSNRIVYANYVQNYDLSGDGGEFYPEFKHMLVQDDSPEAALKSIKSLREYQLGVVFIDKYGRETPVISNPSGTFILSKEQAGVSNRLKVGFKGNIPPNDFESYKFFIKEVSGEYYNLAMDRFYDAEDGNYWIAFASADRNKVDIDTFLILKKGPDTSKAVTEKARYKILAIENEAPDHIKTTQLNIGTITHDLGAASIKDVFGAGVGTAPVFGRNYFNVKKGEMIKSTLQKIDEIKDDLYVEFGAVGYNSTSNRYRITSCSRTHNTSGTHDGYAFKLLDEFGTDVSFISDDPNGNFPTKINDLTTITFYQYRVENLPQFDGRFFVKVYADEVFDNTMATSLVIESDEYRITAQNKLYYLPKHIKGVHTISGSEVFGGSSPAQYINTWCTDWSLESSSASITNCHDWYFWTAWFTNEQETPSSSSTYNVLKERGSVPGEGDWNDVHFIDRGAYSGRNGKYDDSHWEMGCCDHPNQSDSNEYGVGIWDKADNTCQIDFGYGPIIPTAVTSSSPAVLPSSTGAGSPGIGMNVLGQATVISGEYQFAAMMLFWDVLNLPDTKHISPWYSMFVSGAQFRWAEDPTDTVYTMTGARSFQNRFNYEGNTDGNAYKAHQRPENYRKTYTMKCFPNHDQWNPTKGGSDGIIIGSAVVDEYLNNPGGLIPSYTTLTSLASTNNHSIQIESIQFDETQNTAHGDNRRWSVVPGMALVKYGSTPVNPPIIIKNIDKDLTTGNYTIEFTGWQHTTVNESFTAGGGDALVFKQPVFNGFSPNSAKNINNYNPHTSTTKGVEALGYHMQFIEPIERKQLMPQDPAIWETEPKEENDLDIYYEISASNPVELKPETIKTAVPLGSPISINSGNGGGSDNLIVINNTSFSGDIFSVSETLCIDPAGCIDANGDTIAPVQVGDIFKITHIDGVVVGMQIDEIMSSTSFRIGKTLYHSYYQLDWYNCYSFGNGVESNRIRDAFNLPFISNGVTASTTLDYQYKKEHRKYGLIYSGIYNSTSGVNRLNQFIQAEKITKDINPVYGSIQKLHTRDTDLITLCEDKILKILANKDALYNADGTTNVTSSSNVLGTALAFSGEFGISKDPGSFASESYRVYFTDKVRGAVMRLSKDGLTPISDHGMKDWFRDNLRLSSKLIGSYDDKKDEYNITLNTTVEEPDKGQTVSFREDIKGWVSFKSFIPENAISCANEYYTFVDSGLWQHHVEMFDMSTGSEVNRNTFYNKTNEAYSSIDFVLNKYAGTMKSFSTLNYEGSQSKINQLIEYNTLNNTNISTIGTFSDNEYYNITSKSGWYVESIETNKQKGSIDEFIEKEGKWFNYIKGQTVVSNSDGNLTINSGFDTADFAIQGIGMLQASAITSVFGCTDPTAFNYDPNANFDDGLCFPVVLGCMDPLASNQGAFINTDDGSCLYPGCIDPTAFNFGGAGNANGIFPEANIDDGSCVATVLGCTNGSFHGLPISSQGPYAMSNYNSAANVEDGSCVPWVFGCTDGIQPDGCGIGVAGACNYDPLATYEDNSCIYAVYGCTDILACDTDTSATHDDGSCLYCGDPSAENYDGGVDASGASCTDGCEYCMTPLNFYADPTSATTTTIDLTWDLATWPGNGSASTSGTYMLTVTDGAGVVAFDGSITPTESSGTMTWIVTGLSSGTWYYFDLYQQCTTTQTSVVTTLASTTSIPGCTDNTGTYTALGAVGMTPVNVYGTMTTWGACNYNPLATIDNGSCFYDACSGCTDNSYTEYCGDCWDSTNLVAVGSGGSAFVADDGSCATLITYGCTDATAFNYEGPASPSFIDDGSCYPVIYGCTDPIANNFIPLVNDVDIDVNTDDGSCAYTCGNVGISINSGMDIDYYITNSMNPAYDSVVWTLDYGGFGSITGNSVQTNYISNASIISFPSGVYSITATFTDSSGVMPDCTETASISIVHGCMDNVSCAFNPLANINNNSNACTVPVAGCMDASALNYQIGTYDQDCIGVCGGSDTSCCCYATDCVQPHINTFSIDNFVNNQLISGVDNSFDVAIANTNPCGGSYGYEVAYRWATGGWGWITNPFLIPGGVTSYTIETPSNIIIGQTTTYPILFDTPARLYDFRFRVVCDSTGATGPWSTTVSHYII